MRPVDEIAEANEKAETAEEEKRVWLEWSTCSSIGHQVRSSTDARLSVSSR